MVWTAVSSPSQPHARTEPPSRSWLPSIGNPAAWLVIPSWEGTRSFPFYSVLEAHFFFCQQLYESGKWLTIFTSLTSPDRDSLVRTMFESQRATTFVFPLPVHVVSLLLEQKLLVLSILPMVTFCVSNEIQFEMFTNGFPRSRMSLFLTTSPDESFGPCLPFADSPRTSAIVALLCFQSLTSIFSLLIGLYIYKYHVTQFHISMW